jgi:hypothetical protein
MKGWHKMAEQFSTCPKCGESLTYGDSFFEDGAWVEVSCENSDCDFRYNEIYVFSHNEGWGTCALLDDKGEPVDGTGIEIPDIFKPLDK